MRKKAIKVDIGIPLGREFVFWKTMDSLINLDRTGLKTRMVYGIDRELSEKRNQICRDFLKGNAEWLLFVDDDMTLPRNTLRKLLSYDVPVIAPICTMRQAPYPPVVYQRELTGITNLWAPPMDKPFRADVVGTGVLLIRREVIEKMEPPWFKWGDYQDRRMGEDIYFSDRVRFDMGIPIWVDPTIKVGHVGYWEATIDDWIWFRDNREHLGKYFVVAEEKKKK